MTYDIEKDVERVADAIGLVDIEEFTAEAMQKNLKRMARAALEASEAVKMVREQWQDIETAPKDGTEVLTCQRSVDGGIWINISRFVPDDWSDGKWYDKSGFCQPHYWQPIPTPPKEED
ncbi:MAG: hypothetical protein Unbinned5081contig1002_7 [Prokaryotic dsDNA virus sp.]|nr:MAG: hypothetical protein Unbinned5081contig1002_7 [Prokaryotic dsDNA virus sp.]|tara:strand:+ start:5501 stop:5857 length:357 start_codon:yes stop_codon:yes gene_type:complete